MQNKSVTTYKANLITALKDGNKITINQSLQAYKEQNGVIKYDSLFAIPGEKRIPELAKKDYANTAILLVAGLTLAFESMNLARPMKGNQIADLAEAIIDTSSEDNLAMEDVMLFLQKLIRGEYGKLYESMDIPKFMELFEKYREERFQVMQQMRQEQAEQHKAASPSFDRLLTIRDLLPKNSSF